MAKTNPPNKRDDSNNGGRKPNKRKPEPGDKFEWRKATRTLTMWILIVILSWIVFRQLNLSDRPEVTKSYSQYRRMIESGQLSAAEIVDREFHGTLKDGGAIITTLPFIDSQMMAEWDSLRIDYQFREKTTSWIGYLITSILPWVIIIGIWLYIMRRMQGGGTRGVFSFGKSRAKLQMENKPKVTFEDVAGVDEAKEELQEIIGFLRDPKKFSRLGGRIPKGALLLGPPGTGKTLLARAIAGEADVPFYSMSGADFVEMFVGVGASRVRDLFEQGKKSAPCIIFIDEIDAVGRHRGAGLGGGHDEREQTLNQLLVEMDGFEGAEGVILIAATNRPDVLDPALTRPGRFDRQIVVDRPDVRGREGILRVHSREIPLASNVKLGVLAKGTPGLAGADLANMVNEAALLAARRGANRVSMLDFEEAKDKVMMGTERKSLLISEEEKKQTAYHEAGHVLVAKMSPGADAVHKVTIIPRGRALGLTHYLPLDEKHNYSRSYLNQTLTHLIGGRVAEMLVFNELSTGAGNDIERATEIARKMICEWGMSDKLGPIALGRKQEEVFLGREIVQNKNYSDRIAEDIDAEMRRIISDAERRAEKILKDNMPKLKSIAEALLEREILDGKEIDILIAGNKLRPVTRTRRDSKRSPQQTRKRQPRRPRARVAVDKPVTAAAKSNTPPVKRSVAARSTSTVTESKPIVKRSPSPEARPTGTRPPEAKPTGTRPPEARPTGTRPIENRSTGARPTGNRSNSSKGESRRDFAKSFGIVSSRDPENRRPVPSRMSKTIRLVPKKDEPASSDEKATKDSSTLPQGEPKSDVKPAATATSAPISKPMPAAKPKPAVKSKPRVRRTVRRPSKKAEESKVAEGKAAPEVKSAKKPDVHSVDVKEASKSESDTTSPAKQAPYSRRQGTWSSSRPQAQDRAIDKKSVDVGDDDKSKPGKVSSQRDDEPPVRFTMPDFKLDLSESKQTEAFPKDEAGPKTDKKDPSSNKEDSSV